MNPERSPDSVREESQAGYETAGVFERMHGAMEKVKERLDRACAALEAAGVPYAVIGGNAVAAWVAMRDDGATRATKDVDLLLRECDADAATEALQTVGFIRDKVMDVTLFIDGPDGKPSQGVHILWAGQKVKPSYATATPTIEQAKRIDDKSVVELRANQFFKLQNS